MFLPVLVLSRFSAWLCHIRYSFIRWSQDQLLKIAFTAFFLVMLLTVHSAPFYTEPSKYHGFPYLFWPHIDYLADFSAEIFCRLFCQLLCRDFVNFLSTFMSRFMSTEFFAYMFVKFFADLYLDPSQNGCLRHFCCTYSKRAGTSRRGCTACKLAIFPYCWSPWWTQWHRWKLFSSKTWIYRDVCLDWRENPMKCCSWSHDVLVKQEIFSY